MSTGAAETLKLDKKLPIGGAGGKRSTGWWGVWTLIVTEGSLFGYLLLSYFYTSVQTQTPWPPEGRPELLMPGINTVILLSSSICVWLAERSLRQDKKRLSIGWLIGCIVLGAVFVGIQLNEWHKKDYGITTNLYGSFYYTITGFHMAHVVVGLVVLSFLLLWTVRGFFDTRRMTCFQIAGIYWHFVDAVWLFVFSSLYLMPYLPGR